MAAHEQQDSPGGLPKPGVPDKWKGWADWPVGDPRLPARASAVQVLSDPDFRFRVRLYMPGDPHRSMYLAGAWIAERAEVRETNRFGNPFQIKRVLLWNDFVAWLVERKADYLEDKKDFYAALAHLGYPSKKSNSLVVTGLTTKRLAAAEYRRAEAAQDKALDDEEWGANPDMDAAKWTLPVEDRFIALLVQFDQAVDAVLSVQDRLDTVQSSLDAAVQTNAWLLGQVAKLTDNKGEKGQ